MSLTTDILWSLDPVAFFEAATGFPADDWQAELLRSPAPQIALLAARQTGKSTASGVCGLWHAVFRGPALVLLLSPTLRQSAELFRTVVRCYHRVGAPVPIKAESALRLELGNGSRIISLPGASDRVRGYAAPDVVLIDECAMVSDELYFSAVRPMRATNASGKLICLTTPRGRQGWFYTLWEHDENFVKLRRIALDCPRISLEFLLQEQRVMPPYAYQSEYLCQFVEVGGRMVFNPELVRQSVVPGIPPFSFSWEESA